MATKKKALTPKEQLIARTERSLEALAKKRHLAKLEWLSKDAGFADRKMLLDLQLKALKRK